MKTYKRVSGNYFLVISIILLTLASCRQKQQPISIAEESKTVDYPVSIISNEIFTDLSDKDSLYPVSVDFLRDFRVLFDRYQGTSPTIRTDFPIKWGVLCIERLPEGKELWMLQSESREWIYLVTVAGSGSQRILDILPVAVNIAVQDNEILETEIWTTTREVDGTFIVEKNYEWVKSLKDVAREDLINNPEEFNKKKSVTDQYKINEMGRFDLIQVETVPNYKAIFFFYKNNNKPDEWDETMEILQPFCEENNIYFDEIYSNFHEGYVRDFKLNDITLIDISPYVVDIESGMVLVQNNVEPKTISFGSVERLKIEIKRYFKLMNLPS